MDAAEGFHRDVQELSLVRDHAQSAIGGRFPPVVRGQRPALLPGRLASGVTAQAPHLKEEAGDPGEAAREPDTLEPAAREVLGSPVGEVLDVGQSQRVLYGRRIVPVRLAPAAAARRTAELHDVPHGQPARRGPTLGQRCHTARELPRGEGESVGRASVLSVQGERVGAARSG